MPRTKLHGKTTHEKTTGRSPDITRFKNFGCTAWGVEPKQKRQKWDPRAAKGIFVGLSANKDAFLIHVNGTPRSQLLVTVHAVFDESAFGGPEPCPLTVHE